MFVDVDTGVDDAMALVYLFASDDADWSASRRPRETFPCNKFAATTWGCWSCVRVTGVPVSKGSERPVSTPLRTAEDTHGPAGYGVCASCRRPTGSSPRTMRRRPGSGRRTRIRVSWSGSPSGPLTNLALALRIEPALPKLLRRLVIMGGAFEYRGNTTPVAEWNISVDPEAAAEVFAVWGAAWGLQPPKHIPIVLGLNLTENIAMTPTILSRLATAAESSSIPMSVLDDRGIRSVASNPLIRVLEDAMRFYFEFHFDQGEGYLAHLHDPLAAAVALDPDLVAVQAGHGRCRADGHADPRHDRRRLERPLGPRTQRAHRHRGGPGRILRPVHRPGRAFAQRLG